MSAARDAGTADGRRAVGMLLLVGAVGCFACLDATAKWVNQTTDPMLTVIARYLGSFLLTLLLCNPLTRAGLPRTRSFALQCARALCLVVATVSSFFAFRHLPLTQATSIVFVAPLLVALAAGPLLGEWPGPRRLGAVAVGFVGVLVVTRPWSGRIEPAVLLAVLTACANALYAVLTRLLAKRDRPLTTLFYSGLIGCAVVLPALPWVQGGAPPAPVWLAFAALGSFGAVGHFLLILAHARAPAATLAPFFYAQLLGATLLGWLVFGEVPSRWTALGGSIIAVSGLYLLYREQVRGGGGQRRRQAS